MITVAHHAARIACAPYYFGKHSAEFERHVRHAFGARMIRAGRENLGTVLRAIYDHKPRIVIGGDCFTAVAAILAQRRYVRHVIWLDAHGDYNDETSTCSGFLGGMPLAALVGQACDRLLALLERVAFPPGKCTHVGGRDWDLDEQKRMLAAGIRLLPHLPRRIPVGSHVHLDVDVLRTVDAPNVTHPSDGGIAADDLERWLIAHARRIWSLSVSAWRVETPPPPAVVRLLNRFVERWAACQESASPAAGGSYGRHTRKP
jgi:arginase